MHVAGSHNNSYSMMSGTSMAAAMVSGGAALLLEGRRLDVAPGEAGDAAERDFRGLMRECSGQASASSTSTLRGV